MAEVSREHRAWAGAVEVKRGSAAGGSGRRPASGDWKKGHRRGTKCYQMYPHRPEKRIGDNVLIYNNVSYGADRCPIPHCAARNVDDDETGLLSTAGHTEVEETVPAHRRGAVERRADGGLRGDGRGRGGGVTRTASSSVIKGRLQVQLGGRPRTYCLISCTPGPSRASQEPQCHLAWSRVPIPSGHPAVLLALPTTTGLLRGHRLDRTGANTPPQPLEPGFK